MRKMKMNHPTAKVEGVAENDDKEKESGDICPDCGQMLVFRENYEKCPDDSCGFSN